MLLVVLRMAPAIATQTRAQIATRCGSSFCRCPVYCDCPVTIAEHSVRRCLHCKSVCQLVDFVEDIALNRWACVSTREDAKTARARLKVNHEGVESELIDLLHCSSSYAA